MSAPRTPDAPEGDGRGTNRRTALVVVLSAIIVVLVVVGIGLALAHPPGESPRTAPTASRTATIPPSPLPLVSGSASPRPSASPQATPDPAYGAPVQQEVRKGQTATYPDGVGARITALDSIDAGGTQVGDVSGPAVRVTIEVSNGSSAALDASGIEVNVYLADGSPASALSSNNDTRLTGELAAGRSGSGTWEFSVPRDAQSSIVVTVSRPGSPAVVVFS